MNNESDSLFGDMKNFDDCTENSNQNKDKLYANARMFLEYEDYSKAYHYYTQLTGEYRLVRHLSSIQFSELR